MMRLKRIKIMNILEKIRDLKESRNYDRSTVDDIANEIEDLIGPTVMWKILRPGFSTDELIENLEYIAKECDL